MASNLQSLIGSLNSQSGTPAPNSTGAQLTTDFNNLVSSIDGTSSPASASTPTLQNFLTNLETNVAGTTGATGTSGVAGTSKLQTDFNNLLSAIGEGTASGSTPTLQDFLNKMASNASSNGQNAPGSLFSAQI